MANNIDPDQMPVCCLLWPFLSKYLSKYSNVFGMVYEQADFVPPDSETG